MAVSAPAHNTDIGVGSRYIAIINPVPPVLHQEGGLHMASLITLAVGVTLVVAAISAPYQDSWYGRWSGSDR